MSRTQRALCAFSLVPEGPSPSGIATGLWYGTLCALCSGLVDVSQQCTEVQEGRCFPLPALRETD